MKTSTLGFIFGILVSLSIGTVQARDDGLIASDPARDCVVQMLMVSLFQIRIGNRRAGITVSASTTNGSTFPMMQ
jgi:hypothetical protein